MPLPSPPFTPTGVFTAFPTPQTMVRFTVKSVGSAVIIDGASVNATVANADPDAFGTCPKTSLLGTVTAPIDVLALPQGSTLAFSMSWSHVKNDSGGGVYSHPDRWTLSGIFTAATSASGTISDESFADNRYTRKDGTVFVVCPGVSRVHTMAWVAQRTSP